MTRLLHLKHWQLFLLLIAIPMLLQMIVVSNTFINGNSFLLTTALPVLMVLVMGVYFGWFYTLGNKLHQKLPLAAPMNLKRFKAFLLVPVLYITAIGLSLTLFSQSDSEWFTDNMGILALIIVPLHLFSMFCIFHSMYFIAKALKSIEWQQAVRFNDFAGEFFFLWFFPIGIWFLQPRINKIFGNDLPADEEQHRLSF